jgi:hypothetical protein
VEWHVGNDKTEKEVRERRGVWNGVINVLFSGAGVAIAKFWWDASEHVSATPRWLIALGIILAGCVVGAFAGSALLTYLASRRMKE